MGRWSMNGFSQLQADALGYWGMAGAGLRGPPQRRNREFLALRGHWRGRGRLASCFASTLNGTAPGCPERVVETAYPPTSCPTLCIAGSS